MMKYNIDLCALWFLISSSPPWHPTANFFENLIPGCTKHMYSWGRVLWVQKDFPEKSFQKCQKLLNSFLCSMYSPLSAKRYFLTPPSKCQKPLSSLVHSIHCKQISKVQLPQLFYTTHLHLTESDKIELPTCQNYLYSPPWWKDAKLSTNTAKLLPMPSRATLLPIQSLNPAPLLQTLLMVPPLPTTLMALPPPTLTPSTWVSENKTEKKKKKTTKGKEDKDAAVYNKRLELQRKITKINQLIPKVVDGYCKQQKVPDNYRSKVKDRVRRNCNVRIEHRCIDHGLTWDEGRQFTPKPSDFDYAEKNHPETDEETE